MSGTAAVLKVEVADKVGSLPYTQSYTAHNRSTVHTFRMSAATLIITAPLGKMRGSIGSTDQSRGVRRAAPRRLAVRASSTSRPGQSVRAH